MRRSLKKIVILLLIASIPFGLFSCAEKSGEEEALPPVVTQGLNEEESFIASIESDGFTVIVYETYSEIVLYGGDKTELVIPDAFSGKAVKKIGERAFYGNEKLVSVTLPEKLIKLDNSAFEACTDLKTVVFGSELEVIGSSAFKDTALEAVTLPDSLVNLGRYSFYRTKIKTVTIPDGVETIGKYAFCGCKELTEVKISVRAENISEYAFADCESLKEIILPEGTRLVGDYCFKGCTALEKIYIPKNAAMGENVFLNCESVTVYTPKGSHAASWAKKYGVSYKTASSADKM